MAKPVQRDFDDLGLVDLGIDEGMPAATPTSAQAQRPNVHAHHHDVRREGNKRLLEAVGALEGIQRREQLASLAAALGRALKDAMVALDENARTIEEQARTIEEQARTIVSLTAKNTACRSAEGIALTPTKLYDKGGIARTPGGATSQDQKRQPSAVPAPAPQKTTFSRATSMTTLASPPPTVSRQASNPLKESGTSAETLRRFFETMSDEVRDACLVTSKVCLFKAGEVIFEQDTIGSAMYFVDSGQVTVSVNGAFVSTSGSGELMGEDSFLATVRHLVISGTEGELRSSLLAKMGLANAESSFHVMRAATVTAEVPCRCLELNVKSFIQAFRGDLQDLGAALR